MAIILIKLFVITSIDNPVKLRIKVSNTSFNHLIYPYLLYMKMKEMENMRKLIIFDANIPKYLYFVKIKCASGLASPLIPLG